MSKIIDSLINLMKWPVAIWLFCSLPAFFKSLNAFSFTSLHYVVMGAGFFMFFIGRTFMDSSSRSNMEVLAHELTHAFFAIITFHKVKNINIKADDTGGSMSFEGDGNWLIVIAPYFFPLYGLFAMIGISIYTMFAPMNIFLSLFLGFFTGFHFDMVGSQIHEKQTDLPKVGYWFCAIFLLPANLWMIGSILAFNSKSWEGVLMYQKLIHSLNMKNVDYLMNLLGI